MSIPPALTPEEWAKSRCHRDRTFLAMRKGGCVEIVETFGDDDYCEACDSTSTQDIIAEPEVLPALAALCLHGQPFGFTREDVDLLGDIAPSETGSHYIDTYLNKEQYARFWSLVARIEALLPPEDV